jgi:hypothetical protein
MDSADNILLVCVLVYILLFLGCLKYFREESNPVINEREEKNVKNLAEYAKDYSISPEYWGCLKGGVRDNFCCVRVCENCGLSHMPDNDEDYCTRCGYYL